MEGEVRREGWREGGRDGGREESHPHLYSSARAWLTPVTPSERMARRE